MTMDTVNGWFEIGGAFITLLSVRQLLRDRMLRGAHWGPTIFFTLWGLWNLAYYPSLHQSVSTVGAAMLVLVNAVYLSQMLRFRNSRWHGGDPYQIDWGNVAYSIDPPTGGPGHSRPSDAEVICDLLERARKR